MRIIPSSKLALLCYALAVRKARQATKSQTGRGKAWRAFFTFLGPGLVVGASGDDPTNISTFTQTGALFGYTQLWTVLYTIPMMIVVQEMCARIAIRTGGGLATVMRAHYAKPFLYVCVALLCIANVVNIGADLGAMADAARLLIRLPLALWMALITLGTLLLQVFLPYRRYAHYLRWLTLSLLAYVVTALLLPQHWGHLLRATFVPTLYWSRNYWLNLAAILGTSISPYLFFWQADQEVEDLQRHADSRHAVPASILSRVRWRRVDVSSGMIFSNLVSWCMIITAASVFSHGHTALDTARQAAQALRPLGGRQAVLFFTIGMMGSGLLAIPIFAGSAAYAIAQSCRWPHGLGLSLRKAPAFYTVIILSIVVGALLNFSGIPSMKALYYASALNGVIAPVLIVAIILLANNPTIMREQRNPWWSNLIAWGTAAAMAGAAIGLLLSAP